VKAIADKRDTKRKMVNKIVKLKPLEEKFITDKLKRKL